MATKYPNWKSLLGNDYKWYSNVLEENRNKKEPKRILLATSIGGDAPSTIVESLIGVSLAIRGADPQVLLCDSILPACIRGNINNYPDVMEYVNNGPRNTNCKSCTGGCLETFETAGITIHKYGQWVGEEEIQLAESIASSVHVDEIEYYKFDELSVGEHAMAGALRFYARGTIGDEVHKERILRRFFKASLLTVFVLRNLLEKIKFDAIVFSHGIYVPLGLIGEVAREKKIPMMTWVTAYRKQRFIFSHSDTYHHTMLEEPVDSWNSIPWSQELESATMNYLESRKQGSRDWIWFHEKPEEQLEKIAGEIGIDLKKPVIGMLTNVIWDAQLHYRANAFKNMLDWMMQTIAYFAKRSELQLLIRIHPAEIRGTIKSRQKMRCEIDKVFPVLPSNVFIIDAESPISTYVAMEACDSVIIYGTKTGVELSARGIPVVVGGEAWIRNKGITMDASSPEEYFRILDGLPVGKRLPKETELLGKKYAYHFFFRRMIPLGMIFPDEKYPPFQIGLKDGIRHLMPGKSIGLDVICNGILKGDPFIYPAEKKEEPEFEVI